MHVRRLQVPLEIAFETDMVDSMCANPSDPFGPLITRGECPAFLQWFWLNFIVDLWFMCDICLNFRTGFVGILLSRLESLSAGCS